MYLDTSALAAKAEPDWDVDEPLFTVSGLCRLVDHTVLVASVIRGAHVREDGEPTSGQDGEYVRFTRVYEAPDADTAARLAEADPFNRF